MDFYSIKTREVKKRFSEVEVIEVYPDFRVLRSKDLMVLGKSFYAIWDEEAGLWSTDEYDVQRLIDEDLLRFADNLRATVEKPIQVKLLGDFSSNSWLQFRNYVGHLSDSSRQLDANLTFSNSDVRKTDYISRRLPYPLEEGPYDAWDEIIGTLYSEEERAKIEWAIGSIVSGDSKDIQKFLVLYGSAGTGKSTILNIIQKLFVGYFSTFEAKALTSTNNSFSTESFKTNPLVAIQHDGDLSKIEDNSKLNSIVSHEDMTINEKYKPSYTSKINAFLFMGTNKPVKITDSKSGLIRRLIDVQPTGDKIPPKRYQVLMSQIDFELGHIAYHCLETYRKMGRDYYSAYQPVEMMLQTDVFFNFVEAHYDIFKSQDGVSLNQAHELYKKFCEESEIEFRLPRYKLRDELKNYFSEFEERKSIDGVQVRSWYSGFHLNKFGVVNPTEHMNALVLDQRESLFDQLMASVPAQYSKEDGTPRLYWSDKPKIREGKTYIPRDTEIVSTVLSEIDTTKEHYVKVPLNHIVIDFDLKGPDGEKSAELNVEAASKWPATYAEYSKSGAGIHLHYNYTGDPTELSMIFSEGIEVKVYNGDSALRRRLSLCNNVPVASISSGLPLKEKKVINVETVKSEKALRELIERNLKKEIHPATKPSIDFIHKILEDAHESGLPYDISDMKGAVLAFANNSSNQALKAIKVVQTMKFKSEERDQDEPVGEDKESRLVIFDVEVFPNLFVVCWKYEDSTNTVRMINPKPVEIESLMKMNLVGFNNRKYDNHILYARFMGYTNDQLYKLSKKIIDNVPGALFGEAYELSYADIYDYASTKQGLKKWQIQLGLSHKELDIPWDQPVPKEMFDKVAEYCENDVVSTEAVKKATEQDFMARKILSDLSGLSVNATTARHTARILFGDDKKASEKFIYTNLGNGVRSTNGVEVGQDDTFFEGYSFVMGKSSYRGEDPGEGGYVYSEPGIYQDVALLDVVSMHPTSIEVMDLFGPYTKKFSELKRARVAIKRGEYDEARTMLGGALAPYLVDVDQSSKLSYALKLVINSVYGFTSAKYDNPFRDKANVDNVVAKRGALFMIDLKHFVQSKGFTVAHIKTDSIKIPNATPEIIEAVMEFGQKYGYEFEHEETYERFCLVNDAVYIAKTKSGRQPSHWVAVGAQFQHPFVFKSLFSKEALDFEDLCEAKSVKTALYLDFVPEDDDTPMALDDREPHFVGKVGLFTPVVKGAGGGRLLREKDGNFHAATGTKGYLWMESEVVKYSGKEDLIDMSYFRALADDAVANISKFGDFDSFVG